MADPPSGTVTFLFTDIEGSTALWERYPSAMRDALARHDDLLCDAIAAHDGHVFKRMGDAFCAAFGVATDALAAALTAQRVLLSEAWGELGSLRVRIALQTGVAELRGGDYFGPTLNRAARLMAAGHGGQILLEQATAELVSDRLPPDTVLRDLGEHHFKDLQRPIHVFQAVSSGLPGDFEPLRSLGPPPSGGTAAPVSVGSDRPSGPDGAHPDGPILRAFLLGGFRLVTGDRELGHEGWRRRTARQLLKCLLSRHHRRMTRDEAFELFWPGSDPTTASTLRSALYVIRRALEDIGVPQGVDLMFLDHDAVGIRPEVKIWVDADAFEETVARGRRVAEPLELLEAADALYRGDYLPDDIYEDWAVERRGTLRRLWTDLQISLAEQRERRGDAEGAVTALERLLRADACDERAARALLELLSRQGRRSDALRVYHQLVRALREELGVEPSSETLRLQQQIAGRSPAGSESAVAPGARTSSVGPRRVELPSAVAFTPSYPFPSPGQLLGRQEELAALEQILAQGRTNGRVVLIGATAGTGKSTLLGAIVRRAQRSGVLCLMGGCFEQEGVIPLGPLHDALADYLLTQPAERLRAELGDAAADLAMVVPELRYRLDLSGGSASQAGIDHPRAFSVIHAYLRGLAERQPVLLCIEDLHAADAATVGLVHYLARQMRRLPIVLIGTFRAEELRPGRPLAELVATLRREGAERITLSPLGLEDTSRLIAGLLEGRPSERLNADLYAATEGNPLFIEQLVLALREEGRINRRDGVWWQIEGAGGTVPTIIREVIGQRFDRLSQRCRETLAMAAVLGQRFEHAALLAALDPDDETRLLEDLEEAFDAQLLNETVDGYAFGHALLREVLYWSLSGPRRMLLHARAGQAFERFAGPRAVERAPELAHHFIRAGPAASMRAKALHYSLEAGRQSAAMFARREALEHFHRACDLIERDGVAASLPVHLEALDGRGRAEARLGLWSASIESLRRFLKLCSDQGRRAEARSRICQALRHAGDLDAAFREVEDGLAELSADGGAAHAARLQLQYDQAFLHFLRGQFRAVLQLGDEMLHAAARPDEPRAQVRARNVLAMGFMGMGQVERGLEQYSLVLDLANQLGDKVLIEAGHENLGIQYLCGGQVGAARSQLEQALRLVRELEGDPSLVNVLHSLGRASLAAGDVEDAARYAEEGYALAVEYRDRWTAECCDLLGMIRTFRCEWEPAESSFRQALEIRESVGHAAGLAESLTGLGLAQERCGDSDGALETYRRAAELAGTMDPCPQTVAVQRQLGRLLFRQGDAAGSGNLELAFNLAQTMHGSIEYGPTLLAVAELKAHEGTDEALALVERATAHAGAVEHTIEALAFAAALNAAAGRADVARRHAERAAALADRLPSPWLHGLAHSAAGHAALAAGEPDTGANRFAEAARLFDAARTPFERARAQLAEARARSS